MRTLGLSTQKTAYIRDLARHTRDGAVVFEELPALADADVIERLTQVKGIGVWTAHMFLIFALRRPMSCRSAIWVFATRSAAPTAWPNYRRLRRWKRSRSRWRPYCTVASWYLWRSLEAC